jgi:hypothetical protein
VNPSRQIGLGYIVNCLRRANEASLLTKLAVVTAIRCWLREDGRLTRAEKTIRLNQAVLRKGATLDIRRSTGKSSLTISAKPDGVWGCVAAADDVCRPS